MRIEIPPHAAAVIRALTELGYEAYVVGGCVRDSLMGREPNDWDVTTSAKPEEVMLLFGALRGFKTYPTGIAHGTVMVLSKGQPVEVTTFRIDGEYTDGRRPDSVDFTDSLEEDLARRDFTINAMAYSHKRGLCDPYGGEADLAAKVIRCVGDPTRRFSEDALRIMRAVRFSSVLGFSVDDDTAEAAIGLRGSLANISKERIHTELEKLLCGMNAPAVIERFYPIFCEILPPLAKRHPSEVRAALGRLAGEEMPLMMAALLSGDCDAETLLRDLRFPKRTTGRTVQILAHCKTPLPDKPAIRHLCRNIGIDGARDVIRYGIACGTADEQAMQNLDEIAEAGDCLSLSALRINGRILQSLGVPKREIGTVLERLLCRVMADEVQNRTAELKRAVKDELKGLKQSNEGSTAL